MNRLFLWHEAKSFLRQVIRLTINTIEATTFVSRWNDSPVVFTLFLYIYLQNKICTESVALIHLQQNGDREEGNKKCPEKETIHNYAIYVWKYRVVFLTGPLLKMSLDCPPPPNLLGLAPPKFSKCWSHIHFARHLDVFRSLGGPVWDSDDFLKSVTYRPTLSKFRGGPVKKTTL